MNTSSLATVDVTHKCHTCQPASQPIQILFFAYSVVFFFSYLLCDSNSSRCHALNLISPHTHRSTYIHTNIHNNLSTLCARVLFLLFMCSRSSIHVPTYYVLGSISHIAICTQNCLCMYIHTYVYTIVFGTSYRVQFVSWPILYLKQPN